MWDDDSEEAMACEHDCESDDDDLDELGVSGYEDDDLSKRGGYSSEEQE